MSQPLSHPQFGIQNSSIDKHSWRVYHKQVSLGRQMSVPQTHNLMVEGHIQGKHVTRRGFGVFPPVRSARSRRSALGHGRRLGSFSKRGRRKAAGRGEEKGGASPAPPDARAATRRSTPPPAPIPARARREWRGGAHARGRGARRRGRARAGLCPNAAAGGERRCRGRGGSGRAGGGPRVLRPGPEPSLWR